MKQSPISRTVALAIVALIVVLGFVLGMIPREGGEREPSALSSGRKGRLAIYLTLRELGFETRVWRGAPGELPRARAALWLAAAPEEPPEYLRRIWAEMDAAEEEALAVDDTLEPGARGAALAPEAATPAARRLRDPQHYRRFLEEGGILIFGFDQERRDFLEGELGLDELRRIEIARSPEEEDKGEALRQELVTRRGAPLAVEWPGLRWMLAPAGGPFETLVADAADPARAAVLRLAVGRGELVLLAEDGLIDNAHAGRADHALLVVRTLEELEPFEALLFDEYALGGWAPDTPLELALAPARRGIVLHVVLLVALVVWSFAWAAAFPRDVEPLRATSPRARARSHGAVLARLGRYDLLGGMLRRGVIANLRGRGRPGAPGDPPDARAALASIAHLARGPAELKRWEWALAGGPVASEEELEELSAALLRLERLARAGSKDHNARPSKEPLRDGR